ncbi:MAG: DUF294 nucleotidyltransferase-like domain-containing protein [Caenispirillum sp.]|nr:DUF294 nucleotidyltransferase-like domain-containing protein [Caenispirillum sp.]
MTPAPTDPADIRSFLALHHPFDLLPADVLAAVAAEVNTIRVAPGHVLMKPGDAVDCLYVVRSGALETRGPDGELLARLGEGECGGVRALLRGGKAVNQNAAIEESVLIRLPAALFENLRRDHRGFAYFFAAFDGGRLQDSIDETMGRRSMDLMSKTVGQLLSRGPVTVPKGATILDAARVMRERNVSCVMVTDDNALVGIFTDRDLRNRVVAAARSPQEPVAAIMTADPLSVPATAWLFQAMLLMSRHAIHHLPVTRADGKPAGVITVTDLLRNQARSTALVAGDIYQRHDPEGIGQALTIIPDIVHDLVASGASSYAIGHAISSLADAATIRILQLAEEAFGPPPVPYLWLAVGSQGRNEQTARSDQDNCMVLSDDYDPARHGEYFEKLATFVCQGLATAGYMLCPGEVMAMNPKWRQSLTGWKATFGRWIDEPQPKALMYSSVFFDMRPIAGEMGLFDDLHAHVLKKAQGSRLFLGHMTGNALTHRPPLGFFRNLVLISGGEHDHALDLKHTGIVPIVDLARIYALDAGLPQVNTKDRLEVACESAKVSREGSRDLMDALEFLGLVRLRHQARLIRDGQSADNYLQPEELSSFERSHLKDAFAVVKNMQSAAASTYRGGMG